jgi:D-glycero-D-manno-heptose 1,7-bisphosphate phosphatase
VLRVCADHHEILVKLVRMGLPSAPISTRADACYRPSVGGRGLFLDWGGTLVLTRDNRTVLDQEGCPVLMPHVSERLAGARPQFDGCFIVSNQGRIGRGEITEAAVLERFRWLNRRLGAPFTDWRLCPHQAGEGCCCRKPQPGMFLELAAAWDLDLERSIHVGDSPSDRDAAAASGIRVFHWAHDFFGWPPQAR